MKEKPKLILIKDNSDRAKFTVIAMIIGLVLHGIAIFAISSAIDIAKRAKQGLATSSEIDSFQMLIAVPLIVWVSVVAIAGIVFLTWFGRAYKNLATCGRFTSTNYSHGWAVGAWFVPFLNFVRPVQIMFEIWDKMQKLAYVRTKEDLPKVKPMPIIGVWWAFTIFDGILTRIANINNDPYDIDGAIAGLQFYMYSFAFGIIGSVLLIIIIRKISKVEGIAMERHNSEAELSDNPFADSGTNNLVPHSASAFSGEDEFS